jgi:hypothetical protein
MSVKTALYSIVTNDSGVSGIIGTKLYPSVAPSSAIAPYVVYSVVSDSPVHSVAAALDMVRYRVQFSCYAFDSATNTSLVSSLKALLDKHRFSGEGYDLSFAEENEVESVTPPPDASEQFSYVCHADYFAWFKTLS